MKSIKEKAHEIGWVHSKHYDPIVCKQEWCEMSAREGSNYVLGQVEILLNSQRFVDNPSEELFELIKQLKK